MTKPIQLAAVEGTLQITAAAGDESQPTFDVLAYAGGALSLPAAYDKPVVVDLNGLKFRNTVIANLDHDSRKRVGHVTDTIVENGQLRLRGVFSAANESRDEVIASAKSGFPFQASIEAQPHTMEVIRRRHKTVVNGQTIVGPALVARSTTLTGFAFVTQGADDNSHVSIAATAAEGQTMDPKFEAWLNELGFNADDLTDKQLDNLEANYKGQSAAAEPAVPAPEPGPDWAEQIKARRDYEASINAVAARYASDHPLLLEEIQAQAEAAIEAGMPPANFELRLIELTRVQKFAVHSRGESLDDAVIEAAICKSGGLNDLEKHFPEQTLDATDRTFRHGVKLQEVFGIAARRGGWSGQSVVGDFPEVLRAAFPQVKAAGHSTVSLPNILSNTANKFLREGFMTVDLTCMRIAGIRSARDFKQLTDMTLHGDFTFELLEKGSDIEHGKPDETTYTNQVKTYARMLGIDRQDIINDDLDALTAVPRRLGRGGALKLNNVFWTVFLDNATFFTAGRGNFDDGTDSALDSAALSAAETRFLNQTDPDGEPMGAMPAILLVPPSLKTTAAELMQSSTVITGSDIVRPSANVFQGRYRVESSPYMENSNYTGYSALKWYLLANPAEIPVVQIAFLNGNQTPMVDSTDADFNNLGVQMRGYFDFGVSLYEYRGGDANKGEA